MTTTTITATLVDGPYIRGVKDKQTRISLTLPQQWTEIGLALDLSAAALGSYTYITGWKFHGETVTDYGIIPELISSEEGTGDDEGFLLASGCKVVLHQSPAQTGNAEAATMALGQVADTTDVSAFKCHLVVNGY